MQKGHAYLYEMSQVEPQSCDVPGQLTIGAKGGRESFLEEKAGAGQGEVL